MIGAGPHKSTGLGMCELLRPHGEDFLALHFDFDAEGGPKVGALDDASAYPNAPGEIGQFQRVKHRATAGVSDHRMFRGAKTIVGSQLVQIGDVFELAIAEGRFLREGPIAVRLGR
jgi:hypothetical protein